MRYATGGIGIDKVSMGLTAFGVTGNDKFAEWIKDGARLTKVLNPGSGEMTIVIRKVPGSTKPRSDTPNAWHHPYPSAIKKLEPPKFGQTDPLLVRVTGDEMAIVVPPEAKRAKLLRGPNKKNRKAVATTLPVDPEKPTNTIERVYQDILTPKPEVAPTLSPELEPEPVTAVPAPVVAEPAPTPAPTGDPDMFSRLTTAVAEINKLRDEHNNLMIGVSSLGRLYVTIKIQ